MIQGDDGVGEAVSGTETGTTEGLNPGILLQSLRKRYSSQYKLVANRQRWTDQTQQRMLEKDKEKEDEVWRSQ